MTAILRARPTLSMEMIDFQNDDFGIKIEQQFAEIINKWSNKTYKQRDLKDCVEIKKIIQLTEDRTGLKISISIWAGMLAGVVPLYTSKNHIFVDKFWRSQGGYDIPDQAKFIKSIGQEKGYVDLQKARVSGFYSTYTNKIYLYLPGLIDNNKLTPAEMAAVYLHELGHAYEACEYASRWSSTNQVLANITQEILKNKNKADKAYIYRELKTINDKITDGDVQDIVDGKTVAGPLLFGSLFSEVGHQLRNGKYDQTSFEMLADNFATRFGYGRALVTALDKVTASGYEKSWKSYSLLWFMHTFLAVVFGGTVIALTMFILSAPGLLATVVSFIGLLIYGLYFYLIAVLSGESFKDYTYDQLKIRYKRIRNQLVEMLKETDLSAEEIQPILADIYTIDNSINSTLTYKHPLTGIMNLINPADNRASKSIQAQQLMEELAHSDLFLKSAQLRAGV